MLLFAGYLLVAPPMFVFGPLVGLLLLSRPATLREWVWVAAATSWSLLWLSEAGGLSGQFVRAAAVLVSGSYLALTVWRPSNQLSRCLAATAGAGIALGGWMIGLGVRWAELRQSIQLDLAEIDRLARAQWSGMSGATEALADLAGMADTLSMLYPGLLALAAIAGLRLAWSWYHRIAERPIGPAPAPFAAFSFNDQMVWGLVIGVALLLLPLPGVRVIGDNLVLVWAALYAVRGMAVFAAIAGRVPAPVLVALAAVTLLLLPFVLGGLTLLGLADTWLDFRRRLTPVTGGFER
ncbi:MAG TPA: DUF2232 domain-containing protein [Gemmatimonadales bacterium]